MKKLVSIALSLFALACSENQTKGKTYSAEHSSSVQQTENSVNPAREDFDGQAAILKGIEKEGNQYIISVDNIDEKYSSPNNDGNLKIETVNRNPKIRTYRLAENAEIKDDSCKTVDKKQFLTNYEEYLNTGKIAYKSASGEITFINLGCWQ